MSHTESEHITHTVTLALGSSGGTGMPVTFAFISSSQRPERMSSISDKMALAEYEFKGYRYVQILEHT
jgi:hypothetical protein